MVHSHPVTDYQTDRDRPGVGTPRRLEGLVDATFAIVLTLFVIEIAVPEGPAGELLHQLGDRVPTLLTYALTFVVLGALWFGNRTQGEFTRRVDHPLTWLTLLMLGLVALVPFSAGLLERNFNTRVAVVFFGIHMTLIYVVHGSMWLYLTYRPWLLRPDVPEDYRRRSRLMAFLPAIGYAVATALGAAVPVVGFIGYLLVPVPLVAGLFYRGLARLHDQAG